MVKKLLTLNVCLVLALLALRVSAAPPTPTVVVNLFTAKQGIDWPYDFKLLQSEMVEKLKNKLGDKANVVTAAPADGPVYSLDGQVVRMFQQNNLDSHAGGLASNNEIITVHYWLTDASGKKIFDRTGTYNTPSTGSYSDAEFGTAGPMAKDLESDIAGRVNGAKIF